MRFSLLIVIFILFTGSAQAATATARISIQPKTEGASQTDTTPPLISITGPLIQGKKLKINDAFIAVTGTASDSGGVSAVTINNQPASLDENGNFAAEILLKPGNNQVTVVATDIFRNTSSYKFTVVREKAAIASKIDRVPPVITITSPEIKRGVKITAQSESLTVAGNATNAAGVASVTVNEQSATLDENGNFSTDLLLKPGQNQITVTATDIYKSSTTEKFTVARASGLLPTKAKPEPDARKIGKNFALLIGINRYRNIDPLMTAVKDTEEISQVLRDTYGFETRLLLDEKATDTAILKELNNLRSRLTPADSLIIYYAGHGILDKVTDASYWLPFDADLSDDTNWLDTKRITDQLKRITAKQVLIIADSCYSGAISREIKSDVLGGDTRENYLKKLQEKPSRVLIASGGNEPVADSGGNGHSVFAEVLINALKTPDRQVFTAGELLTNRIREAVAGKAEQTPEYKVIRNSGHDSGDFIFVKK